MILSRYTKIYPSADDPESVVLYSTKWASAVLVPSGLIDDIRNGSLSPEEEKTLAGLGLLVSSHDAEKEEMLRFIDAVNAQNKACKFILVLNLDCNLACKYCFEGVRKGKHFLSNETTARFIEFVKRTARADVEKDEIKITFYGGEPLLSIDRIVEISKELGTFAKSWGLKYAFSLVTNGTLLTESVVNKLVPLGLKAAKVTLDGPKDVHDGFRPFKSGVGSFDTITRNLRDVCGMIRIEVGGNYTRDSYREFPRLLDYFAANDLGPDRVPVVKFDPVANESSEFAPPDFHDGCTSLNEPWLAEATLLLREEVLKRGYDTPRFRPSFCMMQLADSFTVNYDGTLYKCPALIGRPGLAVGSVSGGVTEYGGSHRLDDWKNEECLACSYLPMCFGGCKYMKLVRDGDLKGVDCKKTYYDATLDALVSQDLRYERADGP